MRPVCERALQPVCERALQGGVVSVERVCIPLSQDPGPARRCPARPAAQAARGQHGPAAATGPSSGLITQENAWKMGEGGRGAGKGASEEVRRTGSSEEHLHTDAGRSATSFPTTFRNLRRHLLALCRFASSSPSSLCTFSSAHKSLSSALVQQSLYCGVC